MNQSLEIEWCAVPEGPFWAGCDGDSDHPRREVYLPAFKIAKYPTTKEQFSLFVDSNPSWAKGVPSDEYADQDYLSDWSKNGFGKDRGRFPATWVSWYAAKAFCDWVSLELGEFVDLPSGLQWEKAARGTDARVYPWGNRFEPDLAVFSHSNHDVGRIFDGTRAVGSRDLRASSPCGCVDMAGNVWEWCSNWLDEFEEEKEMRGGSWNFGPESLTCSFRNGYVPTVAYSYIGFRCCIFNP